jgi:predicted transcriptional regulator
MAKVTKRERFAEIVAILEQIEGTEVQVEFVEAQVALLDKRAGKERGLTKTQKENEGLKETIVEVLAEADEGATATDVAKVLEVSVQKASQLLRQLVAAGTVTRTEGNGKTKTLFSV